MSFIPVVLHKIRHVTSFPVLDEKDIDAAAQLLKRC